MGGWEWRWGWAASRRWVCQRGCCGRRGAGSHFVFCFGRETRGFSEDNKKTREASRRAPFVLEGSACRGRCATMVSVRPGWTYDSRVGSSHPCGCSPLG